MSIKDVGSSRRTRLKVFHGPYQEMPQIFSVL
jgi:hypothetical protein